MLSRFRFPDLDSRRYYVYAMLCQDGSGPGYVKFGHSSRIGERLSHLRTSCPIPARYFAVVATGYDKAKTLAVELALHRRFSHRRIRGEWFSFDFACVEDKQDFNEGSRFVFQEKLKGKEWWTKMSVASLDAHAKQVKGMAIRIENRKRFKAKIWQELHGYRDAAPVTC